MKLLPVAAGICLALTVIAANATQIPPSVTANYRAGLRGNAGANSQAIKQLDKLVKQHPTDPLAAAYLGASETAHALYVDHPWKKIKFTESGLARLEKSLHMLNAAGAARTPGQAAVQVHVMTTVGCTFVAVPTMFHRLDEGYSVLQKLIKSKAFSATPGKQQAHAYLCAAQAAAKTGHRKDAETYVADLIGVAPTGVLRTQADKLKAKLGE